RSASRAALRPAAAAPRAVRRTAARRRRRRGLATARRAPARARSALQPLRGRARRRARAEAHARRMSTATSGRIAIVGGGPAGSLLAILLAQRGFEPVVIERSARFTASAASGGRSINLALAARGIDALRRAGVDDYVRDLLIPMRGRMVHDLE